MIFNIEYYSLEAFSGDDVGSGSLESLPVNGFITGARVDCVAGCVVTTPEDVELEAVIVGGESVGLRLVLQRSVELQQTVV